MEPKLVAAAIQAGVKHFLPSEYTLDVTHPAARVLGNANMLGARASWADKLAMIASSGQITYTTLVTGGFLDWGIKSGMLGFDLAQHAATLYDGGQHKVTACTVSFVAKAILTALRMPTEKTANKRLYVAEVEYSGEELLRTIELASGGKWSVTQLGTESAKENGMKLQAQGNMRGAYLNLARALNTSTDAELHTSDLDWSSARKSTFNGAAFSTLFEVLLMRIKHRMDTSVLEDCHDTTVGPII